MCGEDELTLNDPDCCEELTCRVDQLEEQMEECCDEVKRRLDGHDGDIININNDIDNLEQSKVDKVPGMGLTHNDFTDADKNKLDGIEAGAQRNVQSDWNQADTTAPDYIKNKPNLIPIGTIWMYGGAGNATGSYTEPIDGWAICNGAAVSRTTYAGLFSVIGTTYGNGDGSSTFNLPDLRGRVPMGSGTGSSLTARTMGGKVGVESVTLTAGQSGMPAHSHTLSGSVTGGAVTNGITGGGITNGITGGGGTTGGSGQLVTSADGAHRHYTRYKAYWTQAEDHKTSTLTHHERFGTYSYAAAESDPYSDTSYADPATHTHTIDSHTHSIPSHTHNLPNHTHNLPAHTHTFSGSIGNATAQNAGSAHTNVQPSLGINFIIRVK